MIEFGVVVVTYNRLEKLKHTLLAYARQTMQPKYLIVVNNASTDGTTKFLAQWAEKRSAFEKIVLNLPQNVGGSGGFYEGQKLAVTKSADWIMIGDDDAYPQDDYIEGMHRYIETSSDDCAIVCGKVLENCQFRHRGNIARNKYDGRFLVDLNEFEYEKEKIELEEVSYLGIIFNKQKLLKAGLVRKDYFIWYDDVEHCIRMRKEGKIICLSQYMMIHDTKNQLGKLSWKSYYGWRNLTDVMKNHFKYQFPMWILIMIFKSIACPLKGKTLTEVKLRLTAMKDGLLGNMGMHNVYKPGWKP